MPIPHTKIAQPATPPAYLKPPPEEIMKLIRSGKWRKILRERFMLLLTHPPKRDE